MGSIDFNEEELHGVFNMFCNLESIQGERHSMWLKTSNPNLIIELEEYTPSIEYKEFCIIERTYKIIHFDDSNAGGVKEVYRFDNILSFINNLMNYEGSIDYLSNKAKQYRALTNSGLYRQLFNED